MEEKFEIWAIVELFGHQKMAGLVTEKTIGGSTFIQVDVPATPQQPAFTRLLNPSALYALNPVTEEVARFQAERIQSRPIEAWDFRTMMQKTLQLEGKRALPGDYDDFP